MKKIITYIEDLAFGGDGVGKVNKKVVFVREGLPGDKVLVRVIKNKKNFILGEIIDFLEESSLRVNPPCVDFYSCGGCALLQLNYFSQINFKEKQIKDTLNKFKCNCQEIFPTEKMKIPFYYRNKMEFSFGNTNNQIVLGMHKKNNFAEIVDIKNCLLQSFRSNEILKFFKNWASDFNLSSYNKQNHQGLLRHLIVRESKKTSELMLILSANSLNNFLPSKFINQLKDKFNLKVFSYRKNIGLSDTASFGEDEFLTSETKILEKILGKIFFISSKSFLQTNSFQMEYLYNLIKKLTQKINPKIVFDLYSGTSTIACILTEDVKKVIAVEESKNNCELANLNLQVNNIKNVKIINKKTEEILDQIISEYQPEITILDPPRAGLHPKVINSLLQAKLKNLIYISCNLQTFARDMNLLQPEYSLRELYPLDMFPHTYHLETVGWIKNKH